MKSTWKTYSLALVMLGLSNTVSADFVGLNIGANHWTPDLTGSFNSSATGSSNINISNDLGLKDHSATSLSISLEHPIPLLPNIKYQGHDLNSSSNSNIGSAKTFNNTTFNAGTINSTLDLSHNEIALYYELLDNWINLDLGLDLRMFDGKVSISDSSQSNSITIDETIPMLYIAARVDLPFTGFYIGANIQQLSIGDNSIEDSTLLVGYESKLGLGIEGGIKTFSLELDDASNLNTNLEYDGLFLNGFYHF